MDSPPLYSGGCQIHRQQIIKMAFDINVAIAIAKDIGEVFGPLSAWLIPPWIAFRNKALLTPKLNPASALDETRTIFTKASIRHHRISSLLLFVGMAYFLVMLVLEVASPDVLNRIAVFRIVFYIMAFFSLVLLKFITWILKP